MLNSTELNGEPIPEAEEITEPEISDVAAAVSDHTDLIEEDSSDVMETTDNTTVDEVKELEGHEAAENQSETSVETPEDQLLH